MANVKYNALSARKVAALISAKRKGTFVDGLGLMLRIDQDGNPRWVLRMTRNGVARDLGLGSAREVELAEARELREKMRKADRGDVDPIAAREEDKRRPTFEAYARELHEAIKGDWKNPKHADQWISSLRQYAFPRLGKVRVDRVDAPAIKEALAPIWMKKPETARRVKQRIARVLSGAIADGKREGPNPAIDATATLPKRRKAVKHFAAMPYGHVPAFFQGLPQSDMTPLARLALQFLVATATRTNEVLGAQWSEIDEAKALWIIPQGRMKMKEEHRVPLSPLALAILAEAKKHGDGSPLVFPGPKEWRPFSNMVFTAALKRWNIPYTAHGFRSAFRDWAEEKTDFSKEIKESALAHRNGDKTERAYRRTKLVEARKPLMAAWSAYLTGVAK